MVVYGLWCLTPLSTIFQFDRGGELYCWWKKTENPEKATACRNEVFAKKLHRNNHAKNAYITSSKQENVKI
jgi:hypothetical protein